MNVFYAIILGLVVGSLMSYMTEYYTSMGRRRWTASCRRAARATAPT
jgi:K(+)-stimulated pyrophosphate-energized sodium pump